MTGYVLIGQWEDRFKAVGPFESADEARAACNALALIQATWQVVPLMSPFVHSTDD